MTSTHASTLYVLLPPFATISIRPMSLCLLRVRDGYVYRAGALTSVFVRMCMRMIRTYVGTDGRAGWTERVVAARTEK